jgi:hypothetical protein
LLALTVFTCVSFTSTSIKLSLWDKIDIPPDDTLEGLELGIGMYTPNVLQEQLLIGSILIQKILQASPQAL